MVVVMKKLRFISIIGLAAAAAVSCDITDFQPEKAVGPRPDEPQKVVYSDVIDASFLSEGTSFKTGVNMSAWQLDNKKFKYSTTGSGEKVTFNYADTSAVPCRIAYALYPDVEVDSLYRGQFYLTMKAEQAAVENGYDEQAAIYAGHVSDKATTLVPIFGLFKFTVDQADIASCEIASSGKYFAGPIKILMDTVPTPSKITGSASKLFLKGNLKKGSVFNVAAMCNDYGNLDITFKNSYGITVWSKTLSGDHTLASGAVVDLGKLGNPNVSSLALKFSSSEYAGYDVKSIIAYNSATKTRLFGGDVNQKIASSELTARFFGIEPADYTGTSIWYLFNMEKDGKKVALPVAGAGFNVPASTEVQQDLGVIAESRNAAPWYYPVEDTRSKCSLGYVFGEANTYLIQCKGSVYSGTVDPDPNIPEEVVIDYRVRGDLFTAPSPEGATFEWMQGYSNSGAWGMYTGDRSKITNGTNYSMTVDTDKYTVTVKNTGAHAQAPILLMKKDGVVLWAWTFWNIAADGTRLEAVPFGGVQLANLDLGQVSTQQEKITAKLTDLRRTTFYYQWGRPIPTFWQASLGASFGQGDSRNHKTGARYPVYDKGATTVLDALQHPAQFIINPCSAYGVATADLGSWISGGADVAKDLWGGKGPKETGEKTIFDPCPKGWRVAETKAYYAEFPDPGVTAYDKTTYPQCEVAGYNGVYVKENVLFTCSGVINGKITNTSSLNTGGVGSGTGNTSKDNTMYWTNNYQAGNYAYAFKCDYYWIKYDRKDVNTTRKIAVTATSSSRLLPVRCQVDEDNR